MNFYIMLDALSFIEENLENPLSQEVVAEGCFCSLSTLQKVFRYALRMGVMEYAARRRLTLAARDILGGELRVVDIALRYQYQSPEVFLRAFKRLWGDPPIQFRQKWKFSGLFPRIDGLIEGGDGMTRKKVDISELYDVLRERTDTYVLCFDIVGLVPINLISREAGDLAIVECLRRIDSVAEEEMLLFRVGGDEFALVTGLADPAQAKAVADKVIAMNGSPIVWKGREVPVFMHGGGLKIKGKGLRYGELFAALQEASRQGRGVGEEGFVIE